MQNKINRHRLLCDIMKITYLCSRSILKMNVMKHAITILFMMLLALTPCQATKISIIKRGTTYSHGGLRAQELLLITRAECYYSHRWIYWKRKCYHV